MLHLSLSYLYPYNKKLFKLSDNFRRQVSENKMLYLPLNLKLSKFLN